MTLPNALKCGSFIVRVVLLVGVVPRTGFCMDTDYVTPSSLCDAERASLQRHPHTLSLRWIFMFTESPEARFHALSTPSRSTRSFYPPVSAPFILALFTSLSSANAPRACSHHLLLLLRFLLAVSVTQSAEHSSPTPISRVRSLTPVAGFFFFSFSFKIN